MRRVNTKIILDLQSPQASFFGEKAFWPIRASYFRPINNFILYSQAQNRTFWILGFHFPVLLTISTLPRSSLNFLISLFGRRGSCFPLKGARRPQLAANWEFTIIARRFYGLCKPSNYTTGVEFRKVGRKEDT